MRKLFLFALVATMFAACATDAIDEQSVKVEEQTPDTLIGTFEGDDSRIQLENGKTVWTEGDLVSVFYRSNANQKWQYQGKTGERSGTIKRVANAEATQELSDIVVVYPYNENYYINPKTCNVEAFLPAEQSYLKDSYGLNGNIMIAQSEYNQFSLKNVCGWLKVQLKGEGQVVKKITLKGNNGEQVAGQIYINSADATVTLANEMGGADDSENGAGGNLVFDDTILTEVTLDCGEGVTLSGATSTFHIALPPQTFTQGLTIEIEDTNALKMTKSTDKEVVISRNAIQPMAAFGYEIPTPKSNEIWYTSIDGDAVTPYRSPSGSKLLSNTYDKNLGVWILSYEGNITKIDVETFATCSRFASMILPEGVLTINEDAFSGCSNLRSLTIPSTLWQIGYSALRTCGMNALYINDLEAYCKISFLDKSISGGYNIYLNHKLFTSLTLPESVSALNYRAFYYCKSLTDVTLHNQVQCIDNYALYRCENLQQLTLGDGVLQIGRYAVAFCSALPEITIPSSVTEIRDSAFKGCSSLKTIYCKATTPPTAQDWSDSDEFEWEAFDDIAADAAIYVPATSINLYKKAAGWSDYADIIVPYDFEKGEVVPESCNQIFYTATAKVEPYKTDGFGANIVSNEWDSETKQGIIIFDGKVTSIGAGAFAHCYALESINIPNSVIRIDQEAFVSSGLKAINIPDSVTSIGGYAFYCCTNLSSVTIGNGVKSIGNDAFFGCLYLTNLDLGNSVTSIGSYAFGECGYLTDITIPESVTEIGEAIFNCCHKLTNIYFKPTTPPSGCFIMFYLRTGGANGVTIYVPYASVDTYKTAECLNPYADKIVAYDFEKGEIVDTTPETWKIRYTATAQVTPYITEVFGANIVSNKWDETTGEGVITFDGEVTSIGNYAFSQCSRLTGIIIPDSVTEIGEYAFNYSGLTNITIPTNVETIGDLAFGDCPIKEFKGKFAEDNGRCLVINGELRFGVLKGITEYTIPEGVTKIGHRAFVRSSLESIIIANDVKKIGPDSFYYCSNLKTVVIGDGVTEMSSTVFDHCENLTNVTLGNSLTNIGYCAFYYCKSLQSITIPDSVTKIDTNAFYGCSSLTTITIPQNVSTILSGAFQYCPNLKTVYCQATTPPYTDSYSNYASYWPTFNDNAEGRVIYVPRNSVNAYKAAGGWKNYSNDIVGYSF